MVLAILLAFLWFWPLHFSCTAMNMAELSSVQYSLRIAKDPVIEPQVQVNIRSSLLSGLLNVISLSSRTSLRLCPP